MKNIETFRFQKIGDVPLFEERKAQVLEVYNALSETEKKIIPGMHCRTIEIHDSISGHVGGYLPKQQKIKLSSAPDLSENPKFLHPLLTNFDFVAAHELYHPVMVKMGAVLGARDKVYASAREAVLKQIGTEYPEIQAKISAVTRALDAWNASSDKAEKECQKKRILRMATDWDSLDPDNHEQLVFYTGLLLSGAYHEAFGYKAKPTLLKPDTTYDEDMCNLHALSYIFGKEKVKPITAALFKHLETQEARYGEMLALEAQMKEIPSQGALKHFQQQTRLSELRDYFGDRYGVSSDRGLSRSMGRGRDNH